MNPDLDAEADAREAIYRRGVETCREALQENHHEKEEKS